MRLRGCLPGRTSRADIVSHILADGLERVQELRCSRPLHDPADVRGDQGGADPARSEVGDQRLHHGSRRPGARRALRGAARLRAGHRRPPARRGAGALRAALDYCVRVHRRYAEALRDAGAHGTAMGGAGRGLHRSRDCTADVLPSDGARGHPGRWAAPPFPIRPAHLRRCHARSWGTWWRPGPRCSSSTTRPTCGVGQGARYAAARRSSGPVNPVTIWAWPARARSSGRGPGGHRGACAPGGEFILGPGCALGTRHARRQRPRAGRSARSDTASTAPMARWRRPA